MEVISYIFNLYQREKGLVLTVNSRLAMFHFYFDRCHLVITLTYSTHLPEPMSPAEENFTPSFVQEITTDSPN
jgi:hypothetical protein